MNDYRFAIEFSYKPTPEDIVNQTQQPPHKVLLRKLWAISKKQGMFTKNVKNDPVQNKN